MNDLCGLEHTMQSIWYVDPNSCDFSTDVYFNVKPWFIKGFASDFTPNRLGNVYYLDKLIAKNSIKH